jgi:hypothetical protein
MIRFEGRGGSSPCRFRKTAGRRPLGEVVDCVGRKPVFGSLPSSLAGLLASFYDRGYTMA